MIREHSLSYTIVDIVIYVVLFLFAASTLLPLMHVVSVSLSGKIPNMARIVDFWPKEFTIVPYQAIFWDSLMIRSMVISVGRVVVGVTLTLLMTVLVAYPLSRDRINMPGRTAIKVFLLFAMLFSGGLIPTFMAYKQLRLLNNYAVLIVPYVVDIFLIMVVMNFFRGIPHELEEAAVLDGAGHFDILFRVFLPISKPVLATVALFNGVMHWNAWFDGIVFLNQRKMWPLQSVLYSTMTTFSIHEMGAMQARVELQQLSYEGIQAALVVIGAIPIIVIYPFLQRYFVTGLTLGAVKE
jgi:putative aldouronate transport system permease protein